MAAHDAVELVAAHDVVEGKVFAHDAVELVVVAAQAAVELAVMS